ncbi:MAG TPA: tripartite tricarboxylate transporter substrate-binding protein [Xanthobacteraceae bacterium]|nr:tripartite tricarboxylate transporter substrate-binding protein [Xanthobacteraceae bacterium]
MKIRQFALAFLAALGLATRSGGAGADPIADFYQGKKISWVLSTGEGGGYASYAHAFAPFFAAHIPGKPEIIVQNMPGAGGIKAMNYLMSVAPKDGTTIGLVHSSVSFAPLYGSPGATFDPRQMNWIGSINRASAICVAWHTAGIKTWQDLHDKQLVVGTSGAGSQMETLPAMLNHLFGTKIKIVSGYKGGNDVFLAMERGEISGRCGGLVNSINSTRPDWFPEKKVTVPIQLAMKRDPQFSDVPTIAEFAKDQKTKQVLKLIFSPQGMDRPILAPPGVPADRVAALRAAFDATMADPQFIAAAKKQHLDVERVSGEEVAEIVKDAYAMPPDIIKAASEATAAKGAQAE